MNAVPVRACLRLVTSLLLCAPLPALAQSADSLAPIGRYTEVFLEHPKVSGNQLVGLRWASSRGTFDPENVRVQAAPRQRGPVCVDVASKDGRYSAENAYDLSQSAGPTPRLKAETRYGTHLRTLSTDDIAVMIRKAQSCDDFDATTVIPAIVAPAGAPISAPEHRELVAFVNADPERITMTLLKPDGETLASGACSVAGAGVRIAYSTICRLSARSELPAGELKLRMDFKERFSTVTTSYTLLTSN